MGQKYFKRENIQYVWGEQNIPNVIKYITFKKFGGKLFAEEGFNCLLRPLICEPGVK